MSVRQNLGAKQSMTFQNGLNNSKLVNQYNMKDVAKIKDCINRCLGSGRFYERFVESQIRVNFPQSFCKHIEDIRDDISIRIDGETKNRKGRKYTKTDVDKRCHIDLFFKFDKNEGKMLTMDVKAPKRIKRQDPSYNYDIEYVEFTNVYGMEGWVRGKSDYIAFVTDSDIIIVNRKRLYTYSSNIVRENSPIFIGNITDKYPNDYLHRLSRRKDGEDLVTILNTEEIRELAKNYGGMIMQFEKRIDWNDVEHKKKCGEDISDYLNVSMNILDYRKTESVAEAS